MPLVALRAGQPPDDEGKGAHDPARAARDSAARHRPDPRRGDTRRSAGGASSGSPRESGARCARSWRRGDPRAPAPSAPSEPSGLQASIPCRKTPRRARPRATSRPTGLRRRCRHRTTEGRAAPAAERSARPMNWSFRRPAPERRVAGIAPVMPDDPVASARESTSTAPSDAPSPGGWSARTTSRETPAMPSAPVTPGVRTR